MNTPIPTYMPRFDSYEENKIIEDRILDKITDPHEPQNIMIAGFPGVGKSYTAKAIAARYASDGRPAVILSVHNKKEISGSRIALVDIGQFSKEHSRVVPIPVVNISASSDNGEEVVEEITNSLKSLEENLKKVKELHSFSSDMVKIKEGLEKLIDHDLIPQEYSAIKTLAGDIIGALPYVGSALNVALSIVDHYRKKRQDKELERLRKQNLLVVVDDVRDLGTNWEILSKVLADSFRYLFVMRIEDIDEYLKLIDDRTYPNRYLHEKNYSVIIKKMEIVPPPSKSIFNAIMENHEVRKEDIDPLWSISGGIPAIALTISQEIPTLTSRDLQLVLQEIGNLIRNKAQIYWSESDYRKRLAMALYATMQIYQRLMKDNKVYGLLCCERDGVTQDEILIFCGCMSENDVIYIPHEETETKRRVEEIISNKCCCLDGRKMKIRVPPIGGGNCSIGHLRKSIVKSYAIPSSVNDLSTKPRKSAEITDKEDVEFSSYQSTLQQDRLFYTFTESFEHIPLLLNVIENLENSGFDISSRFATISSDLKQIRNTLDSIKRCIS
jgi:hypothetical protein